MSLISKDTLIQDCADAYRTASGTSETVKAGELADKIAELSGGGTPTLQEKTASASQTSQEITADTGYDGLSKVTINPATLQTKVLNPQYMIPQNATPDAGYYGLSQVLVTPVTSAIDNNIKAENIKAGVNILGTVGTYTGGGLPTKGFVVGDYDNDGFPTTCTFLGTWEGTLPAFRWYFATNSMYKKIKTITVPEGITILPTLCFYGCDTIETINLPSTLRQLTGTYTFYQCSVKSITLPASCTSFVSNQQFVQCKMTSFTHLGQMPDIPNSCFNGCSWCKLYDFSHCTTVPTLYSATSLGHASDCVIKVPNSLLSVWQGSTNWSALTNVIWEGV